MPGTVLGTAGGTRRHSSFLHGAYILLAKRQEAMQCDSRWRPAGGGDGGRGLGGGMESWDDGRLAQEVKDVFAEETTFE